MVARPGVCLLYAKGTTAVDATPSPDVDRRSPKGGVPPQCATMPSLHEGVAVAVHTVETLVPFMSLPQTVPTATVAQSLATLCTQAPTILVRTVHEFCV